MPSIFIMQRNKYELPFSIMLFDSTNRKSYCLPSPILLVIYDRSVWRYRCDNIRCFQLKFTIKKFREYYNASYNSISLPHNYAILKVFTVILVYSISNKCFAIFRLNTAPWLKKYYHNYEKHYH